MWRTNWTNDGEMYVSAIEQINNGIVTGPASDYGENVQIRLRWADVDNEEHGVDDTNVCKSHTR